MKAMILAAGVGTRLKPWTDKHPKALAFVNRKSLLGSNIIISDETNELLETGGGLKKAEYYFKDENDFVLVNVDVLTDLRLDEMIAYHLSNKPLATLATTQRNTSRYFLFNDDNELCGWRNIETGVDKISKQAARYYQKAFSGIHMINNRIFSLMHNEGKFSMIDVYLEAAKTQIIKSFDHSQSKFIDVGKPDSIIKAETIFS